MQCEHLFIFNTRIDNYKRAKIIEKISFFLAGNTLAHIATINPEILLRARTDKRFRTILNASALNVADGTGVFFAFLRYGCLLRTRFTGVEIMNYILSLAEKNGYRIFLVAYKDGLTSWQKTRDAILHAFPNILIDGCNIASSYENLSVSQYSQLHKSDVVFVNFGAPAQEKFINACKKESISKLRIGVGVGGAFDYIAGTLPRAPYFVQKMGMEWLFRFIVQPHRFKRIFRAVFLFPFFVLFTPKTIDREGNN